MARQLGKFIGTQQVSANNSSFSGIINNLDTLARLKKDFSIPSANPGIVDKFLIAEGQLEEIFDRSRFMANYGYGANDIIFSDDGTRVYFLDDTDVITQYRCNIAGSVERLVCTGQFDLADPDHPNWFMGDAGYAETAPRSIAFGNNGYKFYLVGDVNPDYINEFDLTTPWDLNTATWVRKFDWGAYQSIQFNSDGTKVYTSSPSAANIILQWSLSTAWDVSTITLDSGVNLNSFYDGVVSDHQFKPDGTKLYVSHYDYTFIDEIDLTTAWDLSTAVFNQRLSLVGTDGLMNYHKFALNPDGDKLIISTSSQVQQFDLETPWDISTANLLHKKDRIVMETLARQNGYISRDGHHAYTVHITGDDTYKSTVFQWYIDNAWETQYMSLTGKYLDITDLQDDIDYISFVWFKDDGTKMWIGSYLNDQIWAFDIATPFDISTATYANETFYVGSQETGPRHMFIGDSGSKLYVIGTTGDDITEYSLSTAYDISTATHVTQVTVASTATMGITFDNTGAYVYLVDYTPDLIYRYTLTTAWDLSTLDTGTVQTVTARYQVGTSSYLDERTPYGLQLSSDGTRMVVIGDYRDNFVSYTLSPAWDLSTASMDIVDQTGTFTTNTQNPYRYTTAIDANQDFTTFYVADTIKESIFQYNLSSNTSMMNVSNVYHFSVLSETNDPIGLQLKPDGTEMYVMHNGGNIFTYTLSTPWDIRTATVNASKQSSSLGSSGFRIVNNGTQLIATDDSPDEVQSYTLSTAWDLSTAVIDTNNQLALHNQNRRGPFMSTDGTKLYFHQFNDNWMIQYDLATAWDLSSANTSYVKYYVPDEWHGTLGVGSIFNQSGNTMYHLLSTSGQNWFSRGADSIIRRELSTPWELNTVQHPYYDVVDSGDYFWQYVKHPENDDQYFILSNDGDLRHIDQENRYQIAVVNFKALGRVINAHGFNFKSDGTGLYIVDSNKCSIDYYTLSTAWDITTHDYQYSVTDIFAQTFGTDVLYDLRFKPDGTQLYLLNNTEDRIYQFEMTTPWDIRTMVYNSQFAVTTGESVPQSFDLDSSGRYLLYGGTSDQVRMAILSTAWDISTADTANHIASGLLPGGDTHLCSWIDSTHFIKANRYNFYKYKTKFPYDVSSIATSTGANSFNTYDFNISISQNANYDTEFFQASTDEQYFVYGTGTNHAERMQNTTAGDYSTLTYLTHGTAGATGTSNQSWFANFGYTGTYSSQWYWAKNLWTHENFDSTLSQAFVIFQHGASQAVPDRTVPYGSWVFGKVNTTTNGIQRTQLTQLRNITSGVNTGVSNIGGHSWKRDGTEVYFSANDGKIYAVRVSTPWTIGAMEGYTGYYWTPNSNFQRNLSFCDIKTEAYAVWDSGNTTIRAFDFSDDGMECIILFDNDSKNAHVYKLNSPWDITTLTDTGYRIQADNDLANSVCYRGNRIWLVDKDGKQFNHPVKKYEWGNSLAQIVNPLVITQTANTSYQFVLDDGLDTFVITFAVDETTLTLGESAELTFVEDETQPLANNGTVSINGLVATVSANTTNPEAKAFAGTFYLTEQPMNREFNAGTATFQLGTKGKQYAGSYVLNTGGTLVTYNVSSGASIDAQIDALSNGDALVLAPGTYTMTGGTDAFRSKNICIAGDTQDPNDVIIEHNHDLPSGVRDHPIFNIVSTDLSQQMAFLRYKRIQTSSTNYISAVVKGFGDVKGKMVNCLLDFNNSNISWIYDNNNDPQVDVRFIRCTFYNYATWSGRYSGRTDVVKATDCVFDAGFNTGDVVETNYATSVTVNGSTGAYDTTTHSDKGHLYIPGNFKDDSALT